MKKNYFYTVIFIVFFSMFSFGQQEKKVRQAGKKVEEAGEDFKKYAYINAQKVLLQVAKEGYRSKDLFQKLGDSYYYNADYTSSNIWYSELMEDYAGEVAPEYFFRYAQSLKSSKQYEDSDLMMTKFYESKGVDSRAQRYQDKPEYLRIIDFQKGRYEVANLKVNSAYSDFGPTFYGDELVFASARDTGIIAKRVHLWNGEPFLDLYKGKVKKKSKEVSALRKFSRRLNTKFHESTPVFTNDLKTVYFTRNNYNEGDYGKDIKGVNNLKIYKAKKSEKGKWLKAESIRLNNDQYSISHPALSPDNKKLYFSSNMPGGFGESDIYEATIAEDGTLGDPKNLGKEINTEGKESFPFISKSGDLYFASNGHIGLGGLDLYVTSIDETGSIGEVINLGEPINTSQDDFAFIVNEETKIGYFSSNREGGKGGDDIYKFHQLEEVKEYCEIKLTGIVTDKDTGETLSEVKVTLLDANNTVVKTIDVGPNADFSFVAECEKNYFLRAEKEAYNTAEELLTTSADSETMEVPLQLEKTVKAVEIGEDLGKALSLNPIYFDFDKSNIRYDASVELAKVIAVMKEYPNMKIDVRSHTDSRGDDAYNEILSDRRAKSTVKYIISKGIEAERLSGKGYGESQPVNECKNGVPCSLEQHQLNRRSEFIILEY